MCRYLPHCEPLHRLVIQAKRLRKLTPSSDPSEPADRCKAKGGPGSSGNMDVLYCTSFYGCDSYRTTSVPSACWLVLRCISGGSRVFSALESLPSMDLIGHPSYLDVDNFGRRGYGNQRQMNCSKIEWVTRFTPDGQMTKWEGVWAEGGVSVL